MAYKKPMLVAKSSAKKSYVAGCPTGTYMRDFCYSENSSCMLGKLR